MLWNSAKNRLAVATKKWASTLQLKLEKSWRSSDFHFLMGLDKQKKSQTYHSQSTEKAKNPEGIHIHKQKTAPNVSIRFEPPFNVSIASLSLVFIFIKYEPIQPHRQHKIGTLSEEKVFQTRVFHRASHYPRAAIFKFIFGRKNRAHGILGGGPLFVAIVLVLLLLAFLPAFLCVMNS